MIVYISRDISEEFAVSNLYEDSPYMDCEVDMTEAEYDELVKVNRAYWDWQSRLQDLYEKSPRRDKR